MPRPCRAAKGLDCLSHLIYTVRPCLIHTCHAAPVPCHDHAVLKATSQGHGTARHGMCDLASAVQRRHMGYLPAFGFFRLPRELSRSTRHCRRTAVARHGMNELTFKKPRQKLQLLRKASLKVHCIHSASTSATERAAITYRNVLRKSNTTLFLGCTVLVSNHRN
jgi:hypothetical protein